MIFTLNLPELMRNMRHWVLYALYPDPKQGDPEHKGKYPINPQQQINSRGNLYYRGAKSNDGSTWADFKVAYAAYMRLRGQPYQIPRPQTKDGQTTFTYIDGTVCGMGFMLEGSGITCIDIDDCGDQIQAYQEGRRGGMVSDILQMTEHRAYVEISQSGKGLHIFLRGRKPTGSRKKGGGLEIYDERRFIAMTGNVLRDFHTIAADDNSDIIARIQARYLPEPRHLPTISATQAVRDVDIRKALETARRTNSKFSELWAGDTAAYNEDESRADQALCNILCFYLHGDAAKIDTAFRHCGLMREKWDRKTGGSTYGNITIDKAIRDTTEYFDYER